MDQRKLFIILGISLIVISILQIIMSINIAKLLAVLVLIIGLVALFGRKGLEQIQAGIKRSFGGIKTVVSKEPTKGEENTCKKCGSKLKYSAKFCDECGERQ